MLSTTAKQIQQFVSPNKRPILSPHVSHLYCRVFVCLLVTALLNIPALSENAIADSDGLGTSKETCDGEYAHPDYSGTCDSVQDCTDQRECIKCTSVDSICPTTTYPCSSDNCPGKTPDGLRACNFHNTKKCQLTLDFDCDSTLDTNGDGVYDNANDDLEWNGNTDPTDPNDPTPITHLDTDSDNWVNACDPDDDNDTVLDDSDNCPLIPNATQTNTDQDLSDAGHSVTADALGDACDDDDDGDGLTDAEETTAGTDPLDPDTDNDGDSPLTNTSLSDANDNCPLIPNSDQADFDADGIGNACDSNVDGGAENGNDNVGTNADSCPGAADDTECNIAMCFPTYTGTPDNQNPPVIDGSVNNKPSPAPGSARIDSGWKGATLYTFGNGTDESVATFQAIKDSTQLYFSFEVKTDTSFHDDDLIVLTLRPNSSTYTITDTSPTYDTVANDDIRIFIHPVCNSGADGNGSGCNASTSGVTDADEPGLTAIKRNADVRQIQIVKNSANNWSAVTSIAATGLVNVKVRSHEEGSNKFWSVELTLPVAAAGNWPGISNDFLMYFNIIDVDSLGDVATASQHRWPQFGNNLNHIITNVDTYAYPNYEWGKATRTNMAACQGVSIDRSGIGTKTNADDATLENIQDGGIVYTAPPGNDKVNRFYANVTNTGPDVPVTARFRIADWGYNGGWVNATWRDIPENTNGTNPNPTAPPVTVGSSGAEFTHDWIIADAEIPKYTDPFTGAPSTNPSHQCIMVELDSGSNVNFVKKSDYRNMNFSAVASVFKDAATLSAKGYGKPPNGMDKHEFILKTDLKMLRPQKRDPDKPAGNVNRRLKSTDQVTAKHAGQADIIIKDECDTKSVLRWTSTAYHNSGKDMLINGNKYRVITPTGGFGYYITHTGCGEVGNWDMEFSGMNGIKLEKMKNGNHIVQLAENETIKVSTRIEAKEECRWKKLLPWLVAIVLALLAL